MPPGDTAVTLQSLPPLVAKSALLDVPTGDA